MTMQGAYNPKSPNRGAQMQPLSNRVTFTFRLYRRLVPTALGSTAGDAEDSVLGTINRGIDRARQFIQQDVLAPLQSHDGIPRVLVSEVQCPLIITALDEVPDVRAHFSYLRSGEDGPGYFIARPRNGRGVTHFRIAFHTFRGPVTVDGVQVDGDSSLLSLQALFDEYLDPRSGGSPADYDLYWVNHVAAISAEEPFGASEWLIAPIRNGIRVRQSKERPFTRSGSIEFIGLRSNRDLAKSEDGLLHSLFGLGTLSNLLEAMHLGAIVEGVEAVFETAGKVQGLLNDLNAVAVAATDLVTGAQQFVQISIAKVRGVLDGVDSLIAQLETAYELAIDLPSLTADQLRLLQQSLPGAARDPSRAYILADDLARCRDFLSALLADPAKFAPPMPGATAAAIAVQILPGVTLERLAREANVPMDTIIAVNHLRPPYVESRVRTETIATQSATALAISEPPLQPWPDPVEVWQRIVALYDSAVGGALTVGVAEDAVRVLRRARESAAGALQRVRDGGSPQATNPERNAIAVAGSVTAALAARLPSQEGVLYAGDVLRIPDETTRIPSIVGIDGTRLNLIAAVTGQALTEEDRIFGIDLYLSPEGNLEWDADRFDIRLDRGLEHMANVLDRYMRLPLGALNFAPTVGSYAHQYLARWASQAGTDLLAYAIWRTLRQDPRVRSIRRMRAESEGGRAFVVFDAYLINGQVLSEARTPL